MNTLLLISIVALWIVSLALLPRWKYLWRFLLLNVLFLALYVTVLMFIQLPYLEDDRFGIERLVTIFLAITVHTVVVFIFSVVQFIRRRGHTRLTH